ncbi:unnamed protein product, partial [Scytosiphon promiscuus]
MNRGIYLTLSSCPYLPAVRKADLVSHTRGNEAERIDKVLRKSRSAHDVRSLDSSCPAPLIARATRLSNLYGVSRGTRLARKGAGERPYRKSLPNSRGSSREREGEKSRPDKVTRKQRRILRRALEKAGVAALRLTSEASAGVKAFDGPPLEPADIKDFFRRNFRVRLSSSEAEAIITHFTTKECRQSQRVISIEHGQLSQALRKLRRGLMTKEGSGSTTRSCTSRRHDAVASGPGSISTGAASSSLPLLCPPRDWSKKRNRDTQEHQSLDVENVARALAKVERAAAYYDPRRVENLRQADLSRVTTPRTFGGVLLARFDVRVDPREQSDLVSLLRDENGGLDVERFRTHFLGLIDARAPAAREERMEHPFLPPVLS